jgi:protein-tyrosine phosphatase
MTETTVDTLLLEAAPAVCFRVLGGLWIGSAPPIGWTVGQHFDCLILSAMEYPPGPSCFPKVETLAVSMNDDGTPMRKQEMAEAVRAAGKALAWLKAGKRVLVTCHAGLNRSGLICALVLCKGNGMTSERAVEAVRAARGPNALRNEWFLEFLSAYCSVRKA